MANIDYRIFGMSVWDDYTNVVLDGQAWEIKTGQDLNQKNLILVPFAE